MKKCAPLVLTLALIANIRLGWKDLPGTNGLAYFSNLSVTKKKSLIRWDTCGQCYKTFFPCH
jgi:hypothetical protein